MFGAAPFSHHFKSSPVVSAIAAWTGPTTVPLANPVDALDPIVDLDGLLTLEMATLAVFLAEPPPIAPESATTALMLKNPREEERSFVLCKGRLGSPAPSNEGCEGTPVPQHLIDESLATEELVAEEGPQARQQRVPAAATAMAAIPATRFSGQQPNQFFAAAMIIPEEYQDSPQNQDHHRESCSISTKQPITASEGPP